MDWRPSTRFAASLANHGESGRAAENFNHAIRVDPEYDLPHYNLALLLASCPDATIRNPEEAVRLARGYELTAHPAAQHLYILAQVYAAAGRVDEAAAAAQEAIQLAEAAGNGQFASQLRRWLKLLRDPGFFSVFSLLTWLGEPIRGSAGYTTVAELVISR